MDVKDHRLEIRLPQQQMSELDDIIASVDTPFKPTRSDVVRSFIAQGIERHSGRGRNDESATGFESRLNLYFQMCQIKRLEELSHNRSAYPLGYTHKKNYDSVPRKITSYISADTLVRHVYLEKQSWFFELDKKSLESIDPDLGRPDVLTLMSPQPSAETCAALADVMAVRNMFWNIGGIMADAETTVVQFNYTDVREKLARIKGYVEDKALPLYFAGYPDTASWRLHTEMRALLDWIDKGISGLPSSHFYVTARGDFTAQYATMLQVYQEVGKGGIINLDGLLDLVKDRRL